MQFYKKITKGIVVLSLLVGLVSFLGKGHSFVMLSPMPGIDTSSEIYTKRVLPKLSKVKNTFTLKKDFSLVPKVNASNISLDAASYVLVDLDNGQILDEKNAEQKLPIASLTKVMSSVVALDLMDMGDVFSVSQASSKVIPTRLGVVPGQQMSLAELLKAMIMTSANDAAEVVREGVDASYGSDIFVKSMNEKAKFLGLTNTHFANPQGFDDSNNYSTAEDLAVLSAYALQNYPFIAKTAQNGYDFLPASILHKKFDLPNWNGLIGVYPDVIGLKIGNTDDAKMTTIVASKRGGKRLLAVVLGANDIFDRDLSAAQLLNDGYQQTLGLSPVEVTRSMLQEKYNSWYAH